MSGKASFLGLAGQHVLLTGASGGIGVSAAKLCAPTLNVATLPQRHMSLTARSMLEEGANVTLHFNTQKDSLQPLLSAFPDRTLALRADVRYVLKSSAVGSATSCWDAGLAKNKTTRKRTKKERRPADNRGGWGMAQRNEQEVAELLTASRQKFGTPDVLVLNHGVFPAQDVSSGRSFLSCLSCG